MRACLLAVVPFVLTTVGVAGVCAVALISGLAGAFEGPAMSASLPTLLGERFQDFVGKRAALSFVVQAIGPAIGGALVGLFGAGVAVVTAAVCFALLAAVVGGYRGFDTDHRRRAAASRQNNALAEVKDGLRYAAHDPIPRSLVIYWLLSLSAVPISVMVAIAYIESDLGLGGFHYGVAVSCYAIASLVSSYLAGKANFRGRARWWLLGSGVVYGLANIAMIVNPGFVAFCLLWFVWGLAYGPEEVVGQVVFARRVPERYYGRLYSLMSVVFSGATLLGALYIAAVSDLVSPVTSMVIAGIVFLVATIYSFGFSRGARYFGEINLSKEATG